MHFKKAICATLISTLLFPAVYNIEYVDAAEWIDDAVYSVDIVVDTVEIDINDIPEDRCVKVGISLYNNPGIMAIFIPLEKDGQLRYSDYNDKFPLESSFPLKSISVDLCTEDINIFTIAPSENIVEDDIQLCVATLIIPESVSVGDYYQLNVLPLYDELALCFYNNDGQAFFEDCFNITNGGIRIVGTEPLQTELPQESPSTDPNETEPIQEELPQTEPPQTEIPQITSPTTSKIIESTTTSTSVTTTTNESIVTITENTTISTVSVTTTSSSSSVITTTRSEISKVTKNKNDNNKSKNSLLYILAVLASIGILGGTTSFIIKKSKGHGGK